MTPHYQKATYVSKVNKRAFIFGSQKRKNVLKANTANSYNMNDFRFQPGGKFGPGQEIMYFTHRSHLGQWYSHITGQPQKSIYGIYRQKKDELRELCIALGQMRRDDNATKAQIVALLDHYEFTRDELHVIYPNHHHYA